MIAKNGSLNRMIHKQTGQVAIHDKKKGLISEQGDAAEDSGASPLQQALSRKRNKMQQDLEGKLQKQDQVNGASKNV